MPRAGLAAGIGVVAALLSGCAVDEAPVSETVVAPAVAGSEDGDGSADSPQRPNIVLFLADDLGWGDIGLNGAELMLTPNIDRLGAEGVQLHSFYAGANVCTPSRAALLTGRYANRSGMQHVVMPHSQGGLPGSEATIPEVLRDAGYRTGMIGKWHLGHGREHWPTEHGFDSFFGVAYSNDMVPFDLFRGTDTVQSPADQTVLSAAYAERAAEFIAEASDQPFFLYIAETFPHVPLFVSDNEAGRSEAGVYGDVVEVMDAGIGTVLEALDEAGVADDTLVIITSDNGPWFQGDAGRFRSRKGEMHEGAFRVPFVARWPNGLPAGSQVDHMAMGIDMLPTLAAVAGAPLPAGRTIDGRNILPMMRGETDSPHDVLFFMDGNDIAAVRDARFRLSLQDFYRTFRVPFERFGGPVLYDLSVDERERFAFNREHPEAVERLMGEVEAMRIELAGTEREPDPPFGPADPDTPIGPRLDAP